jgi:hypothetical protein
MTDSHRRWTTPGVPHKGWVWLGVEDVGEPEHTCEMCGQEGIRFVHTVSHAEYRDLEVGCVCAEKMCLDYDRPRRHETKLRNREAARVRWLGRFSNVSSNGNFWMKEDGRLLVVFRVRSRPGLWKAKIGSVFGQRFYPSADDAKLAVFGVLHPRKIRAKEATLV